MKWVPFGRFGRTTLIQCGPPGSSCPLPMRLRNSSPILDEILPPMGPGIYPVLWINFSLRPETVQFGSKMGRVRHFGTIVELPQMGGVTNGGLRGVWPPFCGFFLPLSPFSRGPEQHPSLKPQFAALQYRHKEGLSGFSFCRSLRNDNKISRQ